MGIKLADIATKASNVSTIGGAVLGGVNLVKSLFGNSDKKRREQEAEQDARQLRQQAELNKMGIANSKELADYEQMLRMKMWQDTNYSAQMKEAEKAGMSKAALLGAGGGSTAQGVSVGGMSGGNAADAASAQGAATQNEMMQAQIRNMNADSALKQAQAVKTAGVDTKKTTTETELTAGKLSEVIANTKNIEAKTALTKIQTDIESLNWDTLDITKDSVRLEQLQRGQLALNELQQARNKTWISNETYKTEKDIVEQSLIGMRVAQASMKQGMELDKAKIKEISANINARLEEIQVSKEGIKASKENMESLTSAMLWAAGIHATGQVINGILDIKKMKMGKPKGKTTTETEDTRRYGPVTLKTTKKEEKYK